MEQLKIGDVTVELVLKDIKNVHLSVYPPTGRVRVAAPLRMSRDTLRVYMISKMGWIRAQQKKFVTQQRESPREYINKERHYFLGKRYLMKVIEQNALPFVKQKHSELEIYVRFGASAFKKQEVLENWYRQELKELIQPLVTKWEKRIGVSAEQVLVKKMHTKWGSCNSEAKRIWLNLELVKKPLHCIEYILVHEMIHLLERNHNERFISYMDHFLPEWKQLRSELNKLPISHKDWTY